MCVRACGLSLILPDLVAGYIYSKKRDLERERDGKDRLVLATTFLLAILLGG